MYKLSKSFRLNAQQGAATTADSNIRQGTGESQPSNNPISANFSLNTPQGPDGGAGGDDKHGEATELNLERERPHYPEIDSTSRQVPADSTSAHKQTHRIVSLNVAQQQQQQRPDENGKDDTTAGGSNTVSTTPSGTKFTWPTWLTRNVLIGVGVVLALLIVAIVLLALYIPDDNPSYMYTMEAIKARGNLNCGVGGKTGFSAISSTTGKREGFEIDLCRAVGAALFGEDGHVQYTVVSSDDQFTKLQSKEVDLLAAGTVSTIQRDVFEPSVNIGFSFSTPYLYQGLSFAGQRQFVACAEALSTAGSCTSLIICVQDSTTDTNVLAGLLPGFSGIKVAPSQPDLYLDFAKGYCNVIAAERSDLMQFQVQQVGYTGDYGIGLHQFTKEPLSLVTRDDDVRWSDFVNWVLLGLLSAENQKITQQSAASTVVNPPSSFDTNQLAFYAAVEALGNYGEIYQRTLGSLLPRAYVNMINNGTSPLISSIPLGDTTVNGPGPTSGGMLERIAKRGVLRCGINTAAFFSVLDNSTQQWIGLDADNCRAVAAAIFGTSDSSNTVFIQVNASDRFKELSKGNLDMLSRTTTVTYARDVAESTTGKGFAFSASYFFSGVQFGGIPPYGECADDLDVSSAQCKKLSICVAGGTTTNATVHRLFPDRYVITKANKGDVADCLKNNESNAIAGDGFDTANATIRNVYRYSGAYEAGTNLFSRDNFAVMTNQDDEQWSSFVFLVITSTFYAEEQSITKSTYQKMPVVNLFGPNYSNMLKDVIRAVGSYGEMYSRSAASQYHRSNINKLNTAPFGPQHYPPQGLFGLT